MSIAWHWLILMAVSIVQATAADAAWVEARTGHFVVIGNGKPGEIEGMASELEQFDSVIRRFHRVSDDSAAQSNPVTVYVVPTAADVVRYCHGCPAGTAGFYEGRVSGSIAWTPRRSGDGGKTDLKPRQVLFHEYGHHFLLGNWGRAYPAWFSEGYAEFVATVQHTKDGWQVGAPPLYRAWGLLSGVPLKASDLFDPTRRRTLTDLQRDALYGRGWLLTHYLLMDATRLKQLGNYLSAIDAGTPGPQAGLEAFGDPDDLDKALNRYLLAKRLNVVHMAPRAIPVPNVMARAMTAGEAALITLRMQSRAGVDESKAKPLYAKAIAAAAPYENDAVVQGWLAEMALDAGYTAAALAAADRALAIDPDQSQALIYQAQARLAALTKTPGDSTAWTRARAPIVRANRRNPDAAEPLMLYYKSFIDEGRPVPKIAVQGLLRAVELVPQDPNLRFMAARQMIREKNAPMAARLLRPLAYDPHQPADNPSSKLLALLIANKVDEAAAMLDGSAKKAD